MQSKSVILVGLVVAVIGIPLAGCTTPGSDGGSSGGVEGTTEDGSPGALTKQSKDRRIKREMEECPPGDLESEDAPSVELGVETDIPRGKSKPRAYTKYKCRGQRPAQKN